MKKYTLILILLLASTFAKAQDRPYVDNFGSLYFGKGIVDGSFFDMDLSRSFDFAWDAVKMSFPVGGRQDLSFRISGRWEYFSLGDKYYKMKFHYAGLPVGIFFRRGLFKVGGQITPEYKVYSRVKDKSFNPPIVEHLEGANPFRLTAEVSFSFTVIGLYARYSATPLFRRGYHPGSDARLFTFGLMLDL